MIPNSPFLKAAGAQVIGLGVTAGRDLSSPSRLGGHPGTRLACPCPSRKKPTLGHSLADLLGPEDHAGDVLCDLFRGEPCRFKD